jgi:hypothetical protein
MEQRHPGLEVKAYPFIKLDSKIMVSNITCEKELVTVVTAVTQENEDSTPDYEIVAGPSIVTSPATPSSLDTTTTSSDEQFDWTDLMEYDLTELSTVSLIGEDSIATAMRVAGIYISSTTRIMTWDGLIDYELD